MMIRERSLTDRKTKARQQCPCQANRRKSERVTNSPFLCTIEVSMKRMVAYIGCYGVVAVILIVGILSLATSANGRMILGIMVGIIGLLAIVCIPHNLRIWRVRRVFRSLPKDVRERVLELIEESADQNPSVTYMLLDESPRSEPEVVVSSHVGGVPYAETGEAWPFHGNSDPSRFLLQVRLDEPSLGDRWQDRLIAVFLVFDAEQIVRSYEAPSLAKYVPISSPVAPFTCVCLQSIAFPVTSEDEPTPMSPAGLCDRIPEIRNLLSPLTKDVAGLLSQILRPNVYGYDLEAPEIAYQGGAPKLIQNPHDPICDHCHQRMRFLFQFGEIIPGLQLADAGVCYVYGCDNHPDHCKGFIDSH